jgi:hypothetical protein
MTHPAFDRVNHSGGGSPGRRPCVWTRPSDGSWSRVCSRIFGNRRVELAVCRPVRLQASQSTSPSVTLVGGQPTSYGLLSADPMSND